MLIQRFIAPSVRQIEDAEGDRDIAKRHMLSWHSIASRKQCGPMKNVVRIGIGDFASVLGDAWWHPSTASDRGLHPHMPLNGGMVGASVTRREVFSMFGLHSVALIQHLSKCLLAACINADPRRLPHDEDMARNVIRGNRQYSLAGSLAVVDIHRPNYSEVEITMTHVGTTCVAFHSERRPPLMLDGSLLQTSYRGEVILGKKDTDRTATESGYSALDLVGDTPPERVSFIRFRLADALTPPHPHIVLWTDGSAPTVTEGITLATLGGTSLCNERTEMEITIDGNPRIDIINVKKS